eukprot:6996966-Alexandrium_andersonii.AAC.1
MEIFEPACQRWDRRPPVPKLNLPRAHAAAATTASGQLVLCGGADWEGDRVHASVELFSPSPA